MTFRWYKDRTRNRIDNRNQWNITEHIINNITVTSQLAIANLQVTRHNGTYICDVYNNDRTSSVKERTIVVVEGIFKCKHLMFLFTMVLASHYMCATMLHFQLLWTHLVIFLTKTNVRFVPARTALMRQRMYRRPSPMCNGEKNGAQRRTAISFSSTIMQSSKLLPLVKKEVRIKWRWIKTVALTIINLCFPEGIRKVVISYS